MESEDDAKRQALDALDVADVDRGHTMARVVSEALRGSLDLLVLKTLPLAPAHGWGISQRVRMDASRR